jgi:hypothetical protein
MQLNTFWKRRLAMLPSLSGTKTGITRRTILFLAALGAATLALPTMKWVSHAQSAGPVVIVSDDTAQPAAAGAAADADRREKPDAQSQDRDIVPEIEYLPRPSKFEERVLAALVKPVDIEFSKLSLKDCIEVLQEESKIPIWFDQQSLTDEGVALDQPVTLKLKATRLDSVLNLLLHPVQLTYVPENEVLMVTTRAKASDKLITRTYPVRDLVQLPKLPNAESPAAESKGTRRDAPGNGAAEQEQPPAGVNPEDTKPAIGGGAAQQVLKQGFGGVHGGGGGQGGGFVQPRDGLDFTSLMNLISTTIEPDSWEELSGPGAMMPHRITGCLVIRQTWAIHRQVLQLLRDLREGKKLAAGGKSQAPSVGGK